MTNMQDAPSSNAHRLVVVGAGFAGLALVKALRFPGLHITIVDQRNHHLFQPLLYQVATTILPTSDVAWPVRNLFKTRADVTTILGEVVGIDEAARRVDLKESARLPTTRWCWQPAPGIPISATTNGRARRRA
ncbi:NADH dehydrogenase protein [Shinella sp. DD12]|jgi:NADH dehydrogenase|nr:NADH dehydrogenase protein [Shinella sp. DD12]